VGYIGLPAFELEVHELYDEIQAGYTHIYYQSEFVFMKIHMQWFSFLCPSLILSLQKVLANRHGRMTDLKICLDNFTETREINDDMLTLEECGVMGGRLVKRNSLVFIV
jgi:hypothetical protein